MVLRKGMRVEMCSSEDGFGGAWFEGVILSVTTDGRRCKIQYDKFVTDDGKPVEEEVCLQTEVRPIPPHIQLPLHYSVGDAVEAYDTDCWWRGVIFKLVVVAGAEQKLWMVYFPDTCTLKAYPHSDLRPAQQWHHGNWILAPQERITIIEQVIQRFTLDNFPGSSRKSGGEGGGKKRRRAVKSKAASLGGRASGRRKKLKTTVNTTVSRKQAAQRLINFTRL